MKHSKKSIQFFFIVLILLNFLTGCNSEEKTEAQSQSRLLLGTSCKITIYDHPSEEVFNEAFARISDIEKKMSVHLEDSQISAVNRKAGRAGGESLC